MIAPTLESLMANLAVKTFDGHVSISQFSKGLRDSRDRFVSRLLEEDLIPGSPFALELALVRAYHLAHQWGNCTVERLISRLRLGVYAPHMLSAREVTYEQLATAFGFVMMRQDVKRVTLDEGRGHGGRLVEWTSLPFFQVDPTGDYSGRYPSDLLPELFEMETSDFNKPTLVPDVGAGTPENGVSEGRRKSPVPLMVGRTWNQDLLKIMKQAHPAAPAVGFGSDGASLSLSVVEMGRDGRFAKVEKPMLLTTRPLCLDTEAGRSEPRPIADSDIWILAEYTPPTYHLLQRDVP